MKLFLKEWDELFLIKQSYHITNVDLDKMIDKILVFKEKFHLPPRNFIIQSRCLQNIK